MKTTKTILIIPLLLLLVHGCNQLNEPPYTSAYCPTVSPDGKHIAFYHNSGNNRGNAPFESGIYISSIEGENKKLIYPYNGNTVVKWSPAGSQIVIRNGIIILQNNEFKYFRSNETLGSYADNFSWYPDGKTLLYNINDSIYVCDTFFLNSRKLPVRGYSVTWMPDGERLVYLKGKEIFIADTLNYQEIQITNDGREKDYPACSPDGSFIAFHSYEGISLIKNDGKDKFFLIKGGSPTWTPDSKAIVYSKEVGWDTFLWKINIDGKNEIQISKK